MQFTYSPEAQEANLEEIKLYFHINPLEITMHDTNYTEPMWLQLSLLTTLANGSIAIDKLDDLRIHSALVGWHSHEIESPAVQQLISAGHGQTVTINFLLKCLNCHYQAFPDVITKQNVPFLTLNGRRRNRRNGNRHCTGGCCLKELIVDFNALGDKWNFVIHPRRYQANYCAGSCLTPSSYDRAMMTSNTHILNEMLAKQRAAATSSCCVAADEERVLLAYYVNGGAVRTNNNAIKRIRSCRCS